jgi:hypothetical protein
LSRLKRLLFAWSTLFAFANRHCEMICRVQFEQWVPVAIEKVFQFFANPNNLPRIMPPETGTELSALRLVPPPSRPMGQAALPNRDSLAGVGSEIVTSFRLLPFLPSRAQWIALITEFEWNHHFADIQKIRRKVHSGDLNIVTSSPRKRETACAER